MYALVYTIIVYSEQRSLSKTEFEKKIVFLRDVTFSRTIKLKPLPHHIIILSVTSKTLLVN